MKNKYGIAAVKATLHYKENPFDIVESWNYAVKNQFPTQEASRNKGCPRSAFLGLCEAGYVIGVPKGNYVKGHLNKGYAIKAVNLLKQRGVRVSSPNELWDSVMNGQIKASNSQMDVVLSLWNNGLINTE